MRALHIFVKAFLRHRSQSDVVAIFFVFDIQLISSHLTTCCDFTAFIDLFFLSIIIITQEDTLIQSTLLYSFIKIQVLRNNFLGRQSERV